MFAVVLALEPSHLPDKRCANGPVPPLVGHTLIDSLFHLNKLASDILDGWYSFTLLYRAHILHPSARFAGWIIAKGMCVDTVAVCDGRCWKATVPWRSKMMVCLLGSKGPYLSPILISQSVRLGAFLKIYRCQRGKGLRRKHIAIFPRQREVPTSISPSPCSAIPVTYHECGTNSLRRVYLRSSASP